MLNRYGEVTAYIKEVAKVLSVGSICKCASAVLSFTQDCLRKPGPLLDTKFPMEDYDRLVDASQRGDLDAVELAAKAIETEIHRGNSGQCRNLTQWRGHGIVTGKRLFLGRGKGTSPAITHPIPSG